MSKLLTENQLLVKRAQYAGKLFLSRNDWRRGIHAKYRQLTPKWGMKFFSTREHRDHTFQMHRHLMLYDLSPEVKCPFEFVASVYQDYFSCDVGRYRVGSLSRYTFYGYIVQVAQSVCLTSAQESDFNRRIEKYCPAYDMWDISCANIGCIDGRLVVIDVSCCEQRDNELTHRSSSRLHGFGLVRPEYEPSVYYV